MLKSTDNTFTRAQFVKLREARTLVKEQFEDNFSLHSETVVSDLYGYAVRSESNELFRLFTDINELSGLAHADPLNEEQFILLREAKKLVQAELGDELELVRTDVMDRLFEFSLRSESEALYDIYRYLATRTPRPEQDDPRIRGTYFSGMRTVLELAQSEFKEEIPHAYDELVAILPKWAEHSQQEELVAAITGVAKKPQRPVSTELIFSELSAPDFERLRVAKTDIAAEFDADFSLHGKQTIDDLYAFGLRSQDDVLFDLFCDLRTTQTQHRRNVKTPKDWITKDQYKVLCDARTAIHTEFGHTLELRSPDIQGQLYQYSLQAEEEELFLLCRAFHGLCPAEEQIALPSEEEFKLLRKARHLVDAEFSEALSLRAGMVEYDLYRYAIRSERDDLFDLYTNLMDLPDKLETNAFDGVKLLLSKEEYVELRTARALIAEEFSAVLALESQSVLDDLYRFALDSQTEQLFDIHAELNANAHRVDHAALESSSAALEKKPVHEQNQTTDQGAPILQIEESKPKSGIQRLLNAFSPRAEKESTGEPPLLQDMQGMQQSGPKAAQTQAPAAQDDPEKLDMITRAVMQNKQQNPNKTLTASQPRSTNHHSEPDKKKPKRTLPPLPTNQPEASEGWYIANTDDQFRIRVLQQLCLSKKGELLLTPDQSDQIGAVLQVDERGLLLSAKEPGLMVNETAVHQSQLLENGDQITIGNTHLRVELANGEAPKQVASGASHTT